MTAIDDFFTHYYARRPVNATFTGVHAYDDALPDWSLDGLDALDDEMRSLGSALEKEYPAPASAAAFRNNPDLLDAELARAYVAVQRAENASMHGPRGNPSLWVGESIFSVISLMSRDFAPAEERFQLAAERLRQIPRFLCHSESERSAEGAEARNLDHPDREPLGRDERDSSPPRTVGRSARNDSPAPRPWIEKALREGEGASILLSTGIERWLASTAGSTEAKARVRVSAANARDAFQTFATTLASQPEAPPSALACGPDLCDLLLSRTLLHALACGSARRCERAVRWRPGGARPARPFGRGLMG